jgi:hypothetical protein
MTDRDIKKLVREFRERTGQAITEREIREAIAGRGTVRVNGTPYNVNGYRKIVLPAE